MPGFAFFCVASARFTTVVAGRAAMVFVPDVRAVVPRPVPSVADRADVPRSVTVVVEIRFCEAVRCVALPSRTAAPACAMHMAKIMLKTKTLFISVKSLAKIVKLEQAKYALFV